PRAVSPDMQGDVTRQPRRSPGRIIADSILGAERVDKTQDILNRLFNVRPPSFTQDAASPFFETFRGSTLNDPEGYKALWQGIQGRNRIARAEGRPSTFTGGAVGQAAREAAGVPGTGTSTGFGDLGVVPAGAGPPDSWERGINQVATAQAQGQERGVQWYRMLMGEGREDRMFAYVWDEETPQEELLKQRAGHVADSLNRDDYPQIILESDRNLMKLSREDLKGLVTCGTKIKNTGFLVEQSSSRRPTALPLSLGGVTTTLEEVEVGVEAEDHIPIRLTCLESRSHSRKALWAESSREEYPDWLKFALLDSAR
ncbi:hypothetical protein LCGC14_1597290, partial [marine sediment metagenome]